MPFPEILPTASPVGIIELFAWSLMHPNQDPSADESEVQEVDVEV